ncbi:acetoacetate metabolism regulatory protein AtoC [Candidatus Magnetomorum sp. HK-1]|nr:acetoacetate metabolism regulatory protein AtoC [Candidatus Magnetomorum sp. HK-1]
MAYLFYRKGLETSTPLYFTENIYIGRSIKNISKDKKKREIIKSKFEICDFRNNIILSENRRVSRFHASIIQMPNNQYGLIDFKSKHLTNIYRSKTIICKPWEIYLLEDIDNFSILDWNFTFIKNELRGEEEDNDETETVTELLDGKEEMLKNELLEMDIVIGSKKMYKVYDTLKKISKSRLNVMILGERGTGKELVAKTIHRWSERHKNNFVVVNTPALTSQNLQSELFGHKKGAFTGAYNNRIGKLQEANDGMIFLDEIGHMDLKSQSMLLNALGKEKRICPLGGNITKEINTIVISATNKNLEEVGFLEDLEDRLSQVKFEIAPLRERKEEIPLLTNFFLKKYLKEYNKRVTLSQSMIELLNDYSWPGNTRELEDTLHSEVAMSDDDKTIFPEDLQDSSKIKKYWKNPKKNNYINISSHENSDQLTKKNLNMIGMFDSLKENKWNLEKTAKKYGVTRKTIYDSLKKYGLKESKTKCKLLKDALGNNIWDIEQILKYSLRKNKMDIELASEALCIESLSPLYHMMEKLVKHL